MISINPEWTSALAESTNPSNAFLAVGAISPTCLVRAISSLWEMDVHTPIIAVHPRELSEMIEWGSEAPEDLRFELIPPAQWKENGTLRGHILGCEVHSHPNLERHTVIVFSPTHIRDDGNPASAIISIV